MALNNSSKANKGNILRIFTGDLIENQLKTSVGHNYDPTIADPAMQKDGMIEILKDTNKHLYGEDYWRKLKINDSNEQENILSVAVDGNHEYRSRKASGQWITKDMCEASKTLYLGMSSIIDLTIVNKKLKLEKNYKLYVAHKPSKGDATSPEAILRAFRKKQSTLPGVDIFIFGHFHRKFVSANGYFDTKAKCFRKVLYVINPSPVCGLEYAEEAGYPPLEIGYHVDCFLPLDPLAEVWSKI